MRSIWKQNTNIFDKLAFRLNETFDHTWFWGRISTANLRLTKQAAEEIVDSFTKVPHVARMTVVINERHYICWRHQSELSV